MGVDINGLKLLLHSKNTLNVDFTRCATLGRQEILYSPRDIYKLKKSGLLKSENDLKILTKLATEKYFDIVLKEFFGAVVVDSFDYSDYEGVSILHDFNYPIPNEFFDRYSVVFDGGTLEHIFDFRIAIQNCMRMVRESGHVISISPTNNYHGFYQFSPELWYRVFDESNGFLIKKMLLYVDDNKTDFYQVEDPDTMQSRVGLINSYPTYLFVVAQKIRSVDVFKRLPYQSDYVKLWKIGKDQQRLIPIRKSQSITKTFITYIKRVLFNIAKLLGIKKDHLGKVYIAQAFNKVKL